MRKLIPIGLCIFFLAGCMASSLPLSANINDALMANIKTVSNTVAYTYESRISDGQIIPSKQGSRDPASGHPGYIHTENSKLGAMLKDYINMKFLSIEDNAEYKLKVTLKDFWIEQYSTDSTASQILTAFGGGEINMMVVAHLDLTFEIAKSGKEPKIKNIHVTADSSHVSGIGTNTETSNIYRGKEGIEYRVANAVNAVNNKTIALLNQFIETVD